MLFPTRSKLSWFPQHINIMTNLSENSIKYFANTTNAQHQVNKTLNITAIYPHIKNALIEGEKATKEKQNALKYYDAINENVPNDFSNYTPSAKKLDEFSFVFPVKNANVTSYFGYRKHPITGVWKQHTGIDFGGNQNTPVYAAESGKVKFAGSLGNYGQAIIIEHSSNIETYYCHLTTNSFKVKLGDFVNKSQLIAGIGSTGASTGYHLHFEIRSKSKPIDPIPYLNKSTIIETKKESFIEIPSNYTSGKSIYLDKVFWLKSIEPLLKSMKKKYGFDIKIKDGLRSIEYQNKLYSRYLSGGPFSISSDKSRHTKGFAVDFELGFSNDKTLTNWFDIDQKDVEYIKNLYKTKQIGLNDIMWLKEYFLIKKNGKAFNLFNNYDTVGKNRDLPHFSDTGY